VVAQLFVQGVELAPVDLTTPSTERAVALIRQLVKLVAADNGRTTWSPPSLLDLRFENRPNQGVAVWLTVEGHDVGQIDLEAGPECERLASLLEELTYLVCSNRSGG
jgi:hypothetical protein